MQELSVTLVCTWVLLIVFVGLTSNWGLTTIIEVRKKLGHRKILQFRSMLPYSIAIAGIALIISLFAALGGLLSYGTPRAMLLWGTGIAAITEGVILVGMTYFVWSWRHELRARRKTEETV